MTLDQLDLFPGKSISHADSGRCLLFTCEPEAAQCVERPLSFSSWAVSFGEPGVLRDDADQSANQGLRLEHNTA